MKRSGAPGDRDNGRMASPLVSDPEMGPRRAILGQLPRMYRADGSPIRVLLVDDERALTNLVRMALQYEGWEIDVAHDAREAVAKYRAAPRTSWSWTSCCPISTASACCNRSANPTPTPDAVPHSP